MGESMFDPVTEQMFGMIRGYWVSQIVGTLAELKIPDHLGNGALRYGELAKEIRCDSQATYRLLRASASVGLISAMSDGRFGLTQLGRKLRSNAPGSMRDIAVAVTAPGHWLSWGRLAEAIRSGKRQTQAALGRELFQYYAENPDEGSAFTGAMSNVSTMIAADLARVLGTSTAEHVVDIGGAVGRIIAALLESNSALRGTILELADVVPRARTALAERGLSSRCQVLECNFFKAVPPGDIHMRQQIIHDCDDERSV